MGYPSLLKPRAETLAGEIEDIIEVAIGRIRPNLAVIPHRRVAMIRGRVQTHPPGPGGSRLYKHRGLSLIEMLTPWIVLDSRPT